ncbi:MAG: hypothetical protein AMJ45_04150 [Syntrophobacter sp. DG_60]|nr:MAG: hypothetical protein AMJ45_04150 [Syntrophobacter sp. DG_60]
MDKSILKNNNGAALIITMLIMIVLTVLGIAALMTSSIETKISRNQKSSIQAFYAAEAGIEHAKVTLKGSNNGFDDELLGSDGDPNTADDGILSFGSLVSFGNGTYGVKIIDNHDGDGDLFDDTDNKVVVTSTGTIHGAVKNIAVVVNKIVIPINPDGALGIYGTGPEVDMEDSPTIDGSDHNVPADFDCSGSG